MKKLVLVGVVLIMAQLSFGQFINGLLERTSFGIKAGGNYSNFTNADFNTSGLSGFHGGMIVNFRLTKNFSIQEEFLYSTQGAKNKDQNILGPKESSLRLSYMTIPIFIKYHFNDGFYAELGTQANMLIKNIKNDELGKFADRIDAGGMAGVGYQFRNSVLKGLGVGARYYKGFTNVGKFKSSEINSDFKNSLGQVSVFYIF